MPFMLEIASDHFTLSNLARLASYVSPSNVKYIQLQRQTQQLSELQEIIAAKDAQIAALTARIEELTHRKNSGNNSKPPSSERLNKPAPKSLRSKSGKSAGGQPGHKGSGMKVDREPDEIIEHAQRPDRRVTRGGPIYC